ncbi:MAG: hypothetical protein KF789_01620 [Bdellovibrionaceae bacterium]|nr:hypothetical protein [Pseudobdellovibrionaceae bacterium]
MKYHLFSVLFFALSFHGSFAGAFASSQDDLRFVCATRHLTTTYALFDTEEGGFKLHMVNHEGSQFMPIHEGLITAYDLKFLARKAELFGKMGARFVLSFDKGKCSLKNGEWSCFRPGDVRIGDLDVKDLGFYLRKKKVEMTLITYESYRAMLSFNVGNEGFTIPMEYSKEDCDLKR